MSILDYFPYDELKTTSIRKEQKQLLQGIEKSDSKFILLDAPAGVGKSAVAITASRWFCQNNKVEENAGSYILTIQKYLQSQYLNDFGKKDTNDSLKTIMSANNYMCCRGDRTCKEGQLIRKSLGSKAKTDTCFNSACIYKTAKIKFIKSLYGITNFDYFLYETTYAKQLNPRQLLIIDEAHDTEDKLLNFSTVSFNGRSTFALCGVKMPKTFNNTDELFVWCAEKYEPALVEAIKYNATRVEQLAHQGNEQELKAASSLLDAVKTKLCGVNRFMRDYDADDWILCETEKNKSHSHYIVKPLHVAQDANNLLFPSGEEKIILMSATILDPELLCENLGIPLDQAEYFSVNCPFPKKNRPIIHKPVGKMTYNYIDNTIPKLVDSVQEILENHSTEKGIIHTSSYKIVKAIKERLKNPRILTHTSEDRHKILEYHEKSKEPTVLLSPSMSEGIDLKDDLSRFQIVTKIPYLSLGDEQIKARLELDDHWYKWKTCMILIQSFGRSVRSDTDYATTYVLDGDFKKFYNQNQDLFPPWLNIKWS